jgi:protein-disulfide isomerase
MLRHALCFFWILCSLAPAADSARERQNQVVAIVDGVEVTARDLRVQAQLVQLRKQEYEIQARAVEGAVSRKILERAAASRSLSPEEFLQQEVDNQIGEPAPSEIDGFHLAQREKFREPLENVREQVVQAWKRAKIQEGRQALLRKLRQEAAVEILLEPPRFAVDTAGAPRLGPPAAPVTIVEFSDYQCPYCRAMQPVLEQLAGKYGDRLSLVVKNFPLANLHPQAPTAAEAALCAGEQGKYWDYRKALYESKALDAETVSELARQVDLDAEAFRGCVASRRQKPRVEQDAAEGQQLGVSGTPAYFVNGVFLSGVQPLAAFEKLIEAELQSAAAGRPAPRERSTASPAP